MPTTGPPPGTCETCPYRHSVGQRGLQCRAKPPAAEPVTGVATWPWIKPTDFCGLHPEFVPAPPALPSGQASLPL